MISTNGKVIVQSQGVAAGGGVPAGSATRDSSLLRTLWTAWKAYGHRIATYQTELLLSVVYFVVLGPSGWFARLSGKQLLDLTCTPRASYWIQRKPADNTVLGMQRQY